MKGVSDGLDSLRSELIAQKASPRARLRAAFADVSNSSGSVERGQLKGLIQRLGYSSESASELADEIPTAEDGSVSYAALMAWWGDKQDSASWSLKNFSVRRWGQLDIGVFESHDNDVDEYDGLKVLARNGAFSAGTILICGLSVVAAGFKEFQDILKEEPIIGCTGNSSNTSDPGRHQISMRHCVDAGFGLKGCYEGFRMKKAGGEAVGDILLFSFFVLMMLTLILLRYLLWRDQAVVFELLQHRIFVSVQRKRYICWLAVLGSEVLIYGSIKLWLNDRHEHNEFVRDGLSVSCYFKPERIQLVSHADEWFDGAYQLVLFGLVLQAPVRDVLNAALNLYHKLTIKDILRSGHPRPDRLVADFRLVRLDDVLRYRGGSSIFPMGWGPRRDLEGFVKEFRDKARPIHMGRRDRWEDLMARAYKMANIPPEERPPPGTECWHGDADGPCHCHTSCFRYPAAVERGGAAGAVASTVLGPCGRRQSATIRKSLAIRPTVSGTFSSADERALGAGRLAGDAAAGAEREPVLQVLDLPHRPEPLERQPSCSPDPCAAAAAAPLNAADAQRNPLSRPLPGRSDTQPAAPVLAAAAPAVAPTGGLSAAAADANAADAHHPPDPQEARSEPPGAQRQEPAPPAAPARRAPKKRGSMGSGEGVPASGGLQVSQTPPPPAEPPPLLGRPPPLLLQPSNSPRQGGLLEGPRSPTSQSSAPRLGSPVRLGDLAIVGFDQQWRSPRPPRAPAR
eukprot:TRINITY_DN28951_c0_g1_i1.p1 TRINITY_DN28951_c0_g1~~TRINITY_DN28951_c0_g1_i1.p1  ORF type:complete len:739 (+),score=194.17 TRINITY_DN28951_c0_g1_i1:121-2337(+)